MLVIIVRGHISFHINKLYSNKVHKRYFMIKANQDCFIGSIAHRNLIQVFIMIYQSSCLKCSAIFSCNRQTKIHSIEVNLIKNYVSTLSLIYTTILYGRAANRTLFSILAGPDHFPRMNTLHTYLAI